MEREQGRKRKKEKGKKEKEKEGKKVWNFFKPRNFQGEI
jgi:hypothetical protein